MIEALIDYIQKQGCNIRVEKGCLVLWKEAKGSICQLAWYISNATLAETPTQILFIEALRAIVKLDKKIAETNPPMEPA